MSRLIRRTSVVLAAVAVFAIATSSARAALQAQLSAPATIVINVAGANPNGTFTGTFNGVNITVLGAASNSPGGANAQLFSSVTQINNPTAAAVSFQLLVGSTDFTSPTGAATLNSQIGVSSGSTAVGNSLQFQSYVNADNSQFGLGAFTSGPQNLIVNVPNNSDNSEVQSLGNTAGTFSIVQRYAITVGAGASYNFSSNTNVFTTPSTVIPEPATAISAIVGLASMGLIRLRRRNVTA
jgi:hypothetical protein